MESLDSILGPVRSTANGLLSSWRRAAMVGALGLAGLLYGNSTAAAATNNPPNNNTIAISIPENGSTTVPLPGTTDPDGDTLTYSGLVSLPANTDATYFGTTLTLTPNKDFIGTDTFKYKVKDPSNASGIVTVNITVFGTNQPPTFVTNSTTSYSLLEGDPAISVANWATITPGPANESSQKVTVTATADNPALFQNGVLPTLTSTDGTNYTLNFTPAYFGTGTSTVTFKAQDDGGTANSGNDTTLRTMTITTSTRPDPGNGGGTTPVDPIVNTKTTWEAAGNLLKETPIKGQLAYNNMTFVAVIEGGIPAYVAKSIPTTVSIKYKPAKGTMDPEDKPEPGDPVIKVKSSGPGACLEFDDNPGTDNCPYYLVDQAGRQLLLPNSPDGIGMHDGLAVMLPTLESYATLDKSGTPGSWKAEQLRTLSKASYGNDRLHVGYISGKMSFDKMAKGTTPRKLTWTPSVVAPLGDMQEPVYPTPQSRQHYVCQFSEGIALQGIGSSGAKVMPLVGIYGEYINSWGRDFQQFQIDNSTPIDVANIVSYIDSAVPTKGVQLIRPIRANEDIKGDLSAKIANYSIKWGKGAQPTATPVLLVRNPVAGQYMFILGLELEPGTIPKGTVVTYDIELQTTPNQPPK